MRLPIVATRGHLGKSLELDCDRETITLLGPAGEQLGTLPWEFIINQALTAAPRVELAETRTQARVALTFKVRYRTPEGEEYEGQAGGIGGGGLFIEDNAPLPVGTKLSLEFAIPESQNEWLVAKGVVAWVCPKSDQYTFSAGMGIQFTEIASDTRARILALVKKSPRRP